MKKLDPLTRNLLDLMASIPQPPLAEIPVEEFRAARRRGRDLIANPWRDLPVMRNTSVAGGDGDLRARLYDVEDGDARPTLVYFHGGGFTYGDIDSHDPVCRRLADHGRMRVISIDYRLAPEHPFPAAVEDAIASVAHIAANARDYGVDPARLALGGDSAGANLATVAARQFARENGAGIAHQLLIYPVTNGGAPTNSRREYSQGYFLTEESMAWFDGHYMSAGADRRDERVAPLFTDPPKGLAPAYIITAGFDPLLDEGRDYADALKAAGIDVQYREYPDQIHGFFSFTRFSGEAEGAIKDAAEAVAKALG